MMNINVTIGVTPELAHLLGDLSKLVKVASTSQMESIQAAPIQHVQSVPNQAPVNQTHVPNQQPVNQTQQATPAPVQQPTAVPVQQTQTPPQVHPEQPQQQVAPAQAVPTVPTSETTYSMDQLAVAATQLVDAGKRDELLELLASFGVQALMGLPKEQYGAFATKLREKGAKI